MKQHMLCELWELLKLSDLTSWNIAKSAYVPMMSRRCMQLKRCVASMQNDTNTCGSVYTAFTETVGPESNTSQAG